MFPLGGQQFPKSGPLLAAAVKQGLAKLMTLPARGEAVTIAGEFPKLDTVRIDLTGARVDGNPPQEPRPSGKPEPAVDVGTFELVAHPLYVRTAAVDLELKGRTVGFDYDRDSSGSPLLMLREASDGHVRLQIKRADLDKLLLAAAKEAASAQGVTVTETGLDLRQIDDHTVHVALRLNAKKLIMKTSLRMEGRLAIDDSLVARLSGLICEGEGVIASLACGAIRPHLKKIESRPLPLAALSLGDVRLHDLKVSVEDGLEVTAAFGK